MISDNIINSKDVQLAITLKTNQLKRETLQSLTYGQVLQTLRYYVWKDKRVQNIHTAVNDIMKLDISIIVAYLALQAIEQGANLSLDDVNNVLGGEVHD